jgi:hypothetical protein
MGWYKSGWSANQEAAAKSGHKRRMIRRFWLRPGTSGRLVILDTDWVIAPFGVNEHHFYLDGSWRNWFTCSTEFGYDCAFCDYGSDPEFVSYITIGNLREWTDGKGVKHRFGRELFPIRKKAMPILGSQAIKRDGLTGAIYEITRGTDKDLSTGSQFDFEEKVDILAKFGSPAGAKEYLAFLRDMKPADYLKAYDYKTVLAPLPQGDMHRLVRRMSRGSVAPPPPQPEPVNGSEQPEPPPDDAPWPDDE